MGPDYILNLSTHHDGLVVDTIPRVQAAHARAAHTGTNCNCVGFLTTKTIMNE
jgi:hypothetical protein